MVATTNPYVTVVTALRGQLDEMLLRSTNRQPEDGLEEIALPALVAAIAFAISLREVWATQDSTWRHIAGAHFAYHLRRVVQSDLEWVKKTLVAAMSEVVDEAWLVAPDPEIRREPD